MFNLLTEAERNRFWSKIDYGELESDKCWRWKGTTRKGYGTVWLSRLSTSKRPRIPATRIMMADLGYMSLDSDLCVLHKCNNPSCVNPSHLYLGNHNQNMEDLSHLGVLRGSCNPKAELNEEAVKVIKWYLKYSYKHGMCKKLARLYGVSNGTISHIKHGRKWGYIEV